MYYIYVLKNRRTRKTYIGYTNDLQRRLKEHKGKQPELIYYEAYRSEKDAHQREKQLKQRGQGIRWLKSRIQFSLRE
ncbi:MAG: hypothetical protein A3B37_00155 [Candidatus Sungbacteria bacterium RIFCSPLOWO2_01_FULL_59_16]|uniref:GIY-YIG domain-containing protein n=1 Tax=Candidatus Sungbacteria bacterium RIFCSPLOWO2_01_FULL_59_16 TaxID=1802280 RepID=A0A1G2LA86_9BACT|nr:MAG: hypothetical protein A3B37_00155 [Candidatus Sungbacteria bacterium RIFCSPLOWO2_01_FULL_59_16]